MSIVSELLRKKKEGEAMTNDIAVDHVIVIKSDSGKCHDGNEMFDSCRVGPLICAYNPGGWKPITELESELAMLKTLEE